MIETKIITLMELYERFMTCYMSIFTKLDMMHFKAIYSVHQTTTILTILS
jgi:hypothetical protein